MCSVAPTRSESAGISKAVSLIVKVVPGSSRTHIAGRYGDMLKVKIAAPPEKGKANKELLRLMAAQLKIRQKDIEIESGQTSSTKTLLLHGVTEKDAQTLFSE